MWTIGFWKDLTERALQTFAQGFAAAWIVTTDFDLTTLKVAGIAGLISVAKSLVVSVAKQEPSASTLPADQIAPE